MFSPFPHAHSGPSRTQLSQKNPRLPNGVLISHKFARAANNPRSIRKRQRDSVVSIPARTHPHPLVSHMAIVPFATKEPKAKSLILKKSDCACGTG